jgi:hypothetical protein
MVNPQLDISCKKLFFRDICRDVKCWHHILLVFTHAFGKSEKDKKVRGNNGRREFLECNMTCPDWIVSENVLHRPIFFVDSLNGRLAPIQSLRWL